MSDARIILLAKNHQDASLTGNPERTYFKYGTKTHTNFGEDWLPVDFNQVNVANFGYHNNGSYYIDIPLNGDLLTENMLEITLTNPPSLISNGGIFSLISTLINEIEFLYNDVVLIRYPIEYINMKLSLQNNISKSSSILELLTFEQVDNNNTFKAYLPLSFWFSECSEKALPLWASQHIRYGVRVKLSSVVNLYFQTDPATNMQMNLLCKYGFLDTEEKRKFQNDSLEYIIEQVEYSHNTIPASHSSNIIYKKFNLQKVNYLTEILWGFTPKKITLNSFPLNINSPYFFKNLKNGTILLNGQPIGQDFNEKYYRLIQRYQNHQNGANLNRFEGEGGELEYLSNIYSYSFSLDPDNCFKNSGFLTTEKYNDVSLELTYDTDTNGLELPIIEFNLFICQRKLNIIRIKDGKLNVLFN
jgi:hypothetical protein